jgi:two-component system sensor histidine kinase ChvG
MMRFKLRIPQKWKEQLRPLWKILARISVRMLAFNILLVFLPIASFLYLDTYEKQLLQALEHALVQQGRFLAAALSERGELEYAEVARILTNLNQKTVARVRVIDRQGRLLADSSHFPFQGQPPDSDTAWRTAGGNHPSVDAPAQEEITSEDVRASFLYKLAIYPVKLYRRLFTSTARSYDIAEFKGDNSLVNSTEVKAALNGRFGAATRISAGGQRSVNLYVAIPIWDSGKVIGATLISQSTYKILSDLYLLRLDVFKIFLASLAAAIVCSLFISMTITSPLHKLKKEAEKLVDTQGRLKAHLIFSRRADEIGDLSFALEKLTFKLKKRTDFIESFAADVSHEFKNPLAAIRSAAELAQTAGQPAEQAAFMATILKNTARMEKLVSQLKEMTEIDARLENEDKEAITLLPFLAAYRTAFCTRTQCRTLKLESEPHPQLVTRLVYISPLRLVQVLDNLLDNALSFSPPGADIILHLAAAASHARITVADYGPGLPQEGSTRIFDRFYSYRPGEAAKEHMGLGLAIVKAIVEGYGGTITAANRPEGGAIFTFTLPWQQP